ncbi:MAG TPA: hypothetical protein VLK88_17535 [Gemmatimonadales bacterium]|nr:hypothetical protein [Gemmatimonadales bacterium]
MAQSQLPVVQSGFLKTSRSDAWWVQPLVVFTILTAFVVYTTWAALQNAHYTSGPYISPLYSPELFGASPHALFGPQPVWWPSWLLFSPAILILWAPGGFRFTCYYYRGAYYKAFWADPPACTVGEPRKSYLGEQSFPLILQNIHRYFLLLAVIVLVFLAIDLYQAFWFMDPATGRETFGVGVGTVILALNLTLLSGYTIGCHSMRHIAGAMLDLLSRSPLRKKCYDGVSCLNRSHMVWAWCSLVTVAFSDIYIRLCSMGIWTDWRIF